MLHFRQKPLPGTLKEQRIQFNRVNQSERLLGTREASFRIRVTMLLKAYHQARLLLPSGVPVCRPQRWPEESLKSTFLHACATNHPDFVGYKFEGIAHLTSATVHNFLNFLSATAVPRGIFARGP